MSILHKIRAIFPRRTKVQMVILLFAIISGALLETLALSIISPFISILLDNTIITKNPILSFAYTFLRFRSTSSFLALIAFILAFVYVFRGVYLFFLNKIQFLFLSRQEVRLSTRLLTIILHKPYLYHVNHNLADLTRIISSDVNSFFTLIMYALALLSDFFMSAFILAFLLVLSLPMTIVILFLSLICVGVYLNVFRKKIRWYGEEFRAQSVAMSKAVNHALGGIKDLKVLNREDYFIKVFKRSSDEYVRSNQKFQVYNSLPRLFIEAVCFGGAFILIGVLISLGTDMESMVPQLSVFVLAAFRLLPAISRSTGYVGCILFGKSSVDAIYDCILENEGGNADEPPQQQASEQSFIGADADVAGDIIVQNVTFRYPNMHEPVLKNISLKIPHAHSVAFVGMSGAGKTTLADIILGIYTPESGTVTYKGFDVHSNFKKWTRNIGYIPQQIYLLDETILSNVAFGLPPEEVSTEQVWYALEQAQMKEFVLSLPEGLDTIVGDRGVRLSGGQRQRIGIARALYHNPPILVLDEATSSLDNETEQVVMEAISSFQGSKTLIIIAHRLSTIEHCDIVFTVEDKNIFRER